jgi:hypothetical protein
MKVAPPPPGGGSRYPLFYCAESDLDGCLQDDPELYAQVGRIPHKCSHEARPISAFYRSIPTGMHGPACIVWGSLERSDTFVAISTR